jgi:hypothetical protein
MSFPVVYLCGDEAMEHTHAFQVCETALDQLDGCDDNEVITADDLVFFASTLSEEFKYFKQCDVTSKTTKGELEVKYPDRNGKSILLFLEERDNLDTQRLRFELLEKQRAYNAWNKYREQTTPSMISAAHEVLRLHNDLHKNDLHKNDLHKNDLHKNDSQ